MANTLTALMPKIIARGLVALRKKVIMPRLVNVDYSDEARNFGQTIDVPVPVDLVASDVTPAPTPPTPSNVTPTTVPIPMTNWKHADFHLHDKDIREINARESFIPMEMESAIKALAEAVNASIWGTYKGVYGFQGTAGTTPFASDIAVAAAAKSTLNKQKCPRDMRRMVLNFDAEEKAIQLAPFRDASQSTDPSVAIEGEIGRKLGFDWYSDDDVPTHTAGTGTGYLVNNGAGYAAGTKTITVDTGSGTILEGDILTFAGVTGTYAVVSSVGGATVTSITLKNGLEGSVADNAAITLKASHVVNLAFNRNAIAFATRPLAESILDREVESVNVESIADPVSGLVLRLELLRQYKQWVWDFDILWGVALIRPEYACRLAG